MKPYMETKSGLMDVREENLDPGVVQAFDAIRKMGYHDAFIMSVLRYTRPVE